MKSKWFFSMINFVIILISTILYKEYINKGFLFNFLFVIGVVLIFWIVLYTLKLLKSWLY